MEHSRAQTYLFHGFTPEGLALRSLLSRMIPESKQFSDVLAGRLTALDVTYPATDPNAHPLTGVRAPALAFTATGTDLFALLRADAYLLLDLTRQGVLADRGEDRITVRGGALDHVPDGWEGVRAALIRPDGHVAWARTEQDDVKLAALVDVALTTALGRR